ncbi:DUF1127 domain-containing protein [uncultured Pseudomonas sp.]|uniref:DUF1127 domain-containing protein n=1 Tax=uncultured Pseudomonas sp. TaxID=114707 RepID=UPI0025EA5DC9|nr:DUF1127 domain-containing protein [uncultured Pseudomonas sp.]
MAQLTSRRVAAFHTNRSLTQRFAKAFAWLARALELSRQRRALYRLDDAALGDLGLSRADAWQEADKPFWQQPPEEGQRRSC